MTKNPNDQERGAGDSRIRAFVQQDRESGVHPSIVALHRRPHARDGDGSSKNGAYLRIERGREV